jgi:tRNA-splicing ligase RtcB
MSRHRAVKTWTPEQVQKQLEARGVKIMAGSMRGITSEAPGAYKDVDEVVRVSEAAGIAKKVVKLKPLGVIKG